jgi:DNA-nicking Smr family endonuclease
MSRSPKLPDAALFAALMRDAKPLARKVKALRPAPASTARYAKKETPTARIVAPTPPRSVRVPPPAPAGIANPGIDRRTAERLRKGRMDIDRRLDLHGMTEAVAHATLDRAIAAAWRDGLRVLLVITGKGSAKDGGGVLRRNLPRWLAIGANAQRVLRIEAAQPQHGGGGAFYVLLRRQRP